MSKTISNYAYRFNDTLTMPTTTMTITISFNSNDISYTGIKITTTSMYYVNSSSSIEVYNTTSKWLTNNKNYQNVAFTSETSVSDTFFSWFIKNAIKNWFMSREIEIKGTKYIVPVMIADGENTSSSSIVSTKKFLYENAILIGSWYKSSKSCFILYEGDFTNYNTDSITDCTYMFYSCSSLTSVSLGDLSSCTSCSFMFYSCSSLTSVSLGDLSSCTSCSSMFQACSSLTSVSLGDLSSCTSCNSMFNSCSKLKSLKLNGLKVDFDISASTQFTANDLVILFNSLGTTSSGTITMGSTNLKKLTSAQKAIATNKGWSLA